MLTWSLLFPKSQVSGPKQLLHFAQCWGFFEQLPLECPLIAWQRSMFYDVMQKGVALSRTILSLMLIEQALGYSVCLFMIEKNLRNLDFSPLMQMLTAFLIRPGEEFTVPLYPLSPQPFQRVTLFSAGLLGWKPISKQPQYKCIQISPDWAQPVPIPHPVDDADALGGINIKELRVNGHTISRKDSECPIRIKHTNKSMEFIPAHLLLPPFSWGDVPMASWRVVAFANLPQRSPWASAGPWCPSFCDHQLCLISRASHGLFQPAPSQAGGTASPRPGQPYAWLNGQNHAQRPCFSAKDQTGPLPLGFIYTYDPWTYCFYQNAPKFHEHRYRVKWVVAHEESS